MLWNCSITLGVYAISVVNCKSTQHNAVPCRVGNSDQELMMPYATHDTQLHWECYSHYYNFQIHLQHNDFT